MEDADDARRNAALAASLERLQFVLLNALDSEYGRQIVEDELLLPEDSAKPGKPASKKENAASAKRKRFERCTQCKVEFDVASNGLNECVWHSGVLEVDWNGGFWCDSNEDVHGPINTKENREEYPEGFLWSCCGEQGGAEGCSTGFHKAWYPSTKKKTRA